MGKTNVENTVKKFTDAFSKLKKMTVNLEELGILLKVLVLIQWDLVGVSFNDDIRRWKLFWNFNLSQIYMGVGVDLKQLNYFI